MGWIVVVAEPGVVLADVATSTVGVTTRACPATTSRPATADSLAPQADPWGRRAGRQNHRQVQGFRAPKQASGDPLASSARQESGTTRHSVGLTRREAK